MEGERSYPIIAKTSWLEACLPFALESLRMTNYACPLPEGL
jgi:hypothetical protein